MSVSIVVAYDDNRVIGNSGEIPWHVSEDLKLLKNRTTGCTVIYGRKTWESIKKRLKTPYLPNRINIVITSTPDILTKQHIDDSETLDMPLLFVNEEQVMKIVKRDCDFNKYFVLGGEQIYKMFLKNNIVDKIFVSLIKGSHSGDAFFPIIDKSVFHIVSTTPYKDFILEEYSKNIRTKNE